VRFPYTVLGLLLWLGRFQSHERGIYPLFGRFVGWLEFQ
jgi:hypothetical protein